MTKINLYVSMFCPPNFELHVLSSSHGVSDSLARLNSSFWCFLRVRAGSLPSPDITFLLGLQDKMVFCCASEKCAGLYKSHWLRLQLFCTGWSKCGGAAFQGPANVKICHVKDNSWCLQFVRQPAERTSCADTFKGQWHTRIGMWQLKSRNAIVQLSRSCVT